VGYDADLVLVDLKRPHTIRNKEQLAKCGWSAWDGVELTGLPVRTWVRGREVFRDGVVNDAVRGAEAQFDHARGGYWATS
jgi:dihydroorotase